jgi:pyruvate dehydrogenase E2 component (dihydrolipoamide acetyltransferase)
MSETIHALTMPKLGLTMKEGSVAAWRVPLGSEVQEGTPVAEIETSKITAEYDAPCSGVLRRQVAAQGVTLPVGALIGVVADSDVPESTIDAFVQDFRPETES